MFLPMRVLVRRSADLLQVPEEAIRAQIQNLHMDHKVVVKKTTDEPEVYAFSYYYAELNCARMLRELNVLMESELLDSEEKRQQLTRLSVTLMKKEWTFCWQHRREEQRSG